MSIIEYKIITARAIDHVAKYFSAAELKTLYDFVSTVTQWDIDEPKEGKISNDTLA